MNENYYATLVIEPISPGPSDGTSPPGYVVGSLGAQDSSTYYDGTYQNEIPLTVEHFGSIVNQTYTPEASPVSNENIDFASTQTLHTGSDQPWNSKQDKSSCDLSSTPKNPSYEQLCSELLNDDDSWEGVTVKREISPASYVTSTTSNEVFDIDFGDGTEQIVIPMSDQTTPMPKETPDSGFGECDDYIQEEPSQVAEEEYPLPSGNVDYNFDASGSTEYNHHNLTSMGVSYDINRPILSEYQKINVPKPAPINKNGYSTITNNIGKESSIYQQVPVHYRREYHHPYHMQYPVTPNHIPPYFGMQSQRSQIQNEMNYKTVSDNRSNTTVDVKRHRTAFTDIQIQRLEEEFSKSQYTDRQKRILLSMEINLTEKNIKIWYQNRRMKFKKEQVKRADHVEVPAKPRRRPRCHNVGKYAATKQPDPSTNQVVPNVAFPNNRHDGNGYLVPYYGPQSQQPFSFPAPNVPFGHMCNYSNMHYQMQIPHHFGNYSNNVSSSNRFVNL